MRCIPLSAVTKTKSRSLACAHCHKSFSSIPSFFPVARSAQSSIQRGRPSRVGFLRYLTAIRDLNSLYASAVCPVISRTAYFPASFNTSCNAGARESPVNSASRTPNRNSAKDTGETHFVESGSIPSTASTATPCRRWVGKRRADSTEVSSMYASTVYRTPYFRKILTSSSGNGRKTSRIHDPCGRYRPDRRSASVKPGIGWVSSQCRHACATGRFAPRK